MAGLPGGECRDGGQPPVAVSASFGDPCGNSQRLWVHQFLAGGFLVRVECGSDPIGGDVSGSAQGSYPDISVDTRIVPVGIDENEALEVPDDVRLVGWYDLGVPPGADRGSAVLVAHRDSRTQGHGVFYDLGQLDVGDPVVVRDDAGEKLRYTVVSRESIAEEAAAV